MTILPVSYSSYQNYANIRQYNKLQNNPQTPENQVAFKGLEKVATEKVSKEGKKFLGPILASVATLGITGTFIETFFKKNITANTGISRKHIDAYLKNLPNEKQALALLDLYRKGNNSQGFIEYELSTAAEITKMNGEKSIIPFKNFENYKDHDLNKKKQIVAEAKKFSEEVLNMFPTELHAEVEEILSNNLYVSRKRWENGELKFYIYDESKERVYNESLKKTSYAPFASGADAVIIYLLARRGITLYPSLTRNSTELFKEGDKYCLNGQYLPVPDKVLDSHGFDWIDELFAKYVLEPAGVKETGPSMRSIKYKYEIDKRNKSLNSDCSYPNRSTSETSNSKSSASDDDWSELVMMLNGD